MDLIIDAPDCLSRDDLTNIVVVGPSLGVFIKLPCCLLSNNAGRIHVENVKYRLKGNIGREPSSTARPPTTNAVEVAL